MRGTQELADTSSLKSRSTRRSRLVAALFLFVCYGTLLYVVLHIRPQHPSQDGVFMFSPVVSQIGEERLRGLLPKSAAQITEDQSSEPARHWTFAPIDIWSSPPGWVATLS